MRLAIPAIWVFTLFPGAAIAASSLAHAPPEPETIYGGAEVAECAWPTVAYIKTTIDGRDSSCSGTLIHPRLVLYAAHCGATNVRIRLGQQTSGGLQLPVERCAVYAGGYLGTNTDFAFCTLSEPVEYFPIVPVAMGCETDYLTAGREVTMVGFGEADNGPFGPKRELTTVLQGIDEYGEAFIGGGGKGACNGDSGGPALIRLPPEEGGDGTWRMFGVASFGSTCGNGVYYGVIADRMQWLEDESGIDVTPCHDADGTWNPGPQCRQFPLEPDKGGGSWGVGCEAGAVGDWSATCGAPFSSEPDSDPPLVEITSPPTGQRFDSDPSTGTASVTIDVSAGDAAGWGVETVQLVVDGAPVGNGSDTTEPYSFEDVDFPPGTWTLTAIALDYAGNEAESDEVVIGIDEDPEIPDPGGSETTTDGTESDSGDESSADGESTGEDPADPPDGTTGDGSGGEDMLADGCSCGASRPAAGLPMWLLAMIVIRRRRTALSSPRGRCRRSTGLSAAPGRGRPPSRRHRR